MGGTNLDRRNFLKGAAVGMAGVAAVGLGAVTGCSSDADSEAKASMGKGSGIYPYRVITTDVVIVGGGMAGMAAAKGVQKNGCNCIIVEKGVPGHSSSSGMNWGHNTYTYELYDEIEDDHVAAWTYFCEGLVDQDRLKKSMEASAELAYIEKTEELGSVFERNEDGTSGFAYDVADMGSVANGLYPRHWMHDAMRNGVRFLERTMVVDVALSPEGRAAGVVAIDLTTGEAVVVRAHAVVFSTGAYSWVYGNTTTGAHSANGPESTGDGLGILMRHGVRAKDMEQIIIANFSVYPEAFSGSLGGFMASTNGMNAFCDADGNPLFGSGAKYFQEVDISKLSVGGSTLRMMWYMRDAEGALYAHADEPGLAPRYIRRSVDNVKRFLDYEYPSVVELQPAAWETCATPDTDASFQTTLPGVFWASYTMQSTIQASVGTGYASGKGASEIAVSNDALPAIDDGQIQDSLAGKYGLLDAKGSVRAYEVYRKIQAALELACPTIRTEDGINEGIAELQRIKEEDIPNMYVADKSLCMNNEWKNAIEVENMWIVAMGSAMSALERRESRCYHVRRDYPEFDNANPISHMFVTLGDDGSITVAAEPVDSSIISEDMIKAVTDGAVMSM